MNKKELFIIIGTKIKNFCIIVFIPIFFTVLFCWLFSRVFVEQIPFGVLDMDNSSTSRNIVRQFEDHPGFKVNYHAQSYDELNEKIKTERIQAGIIIPKGFAKDVVEMKAPKTILLIDGTNIVMGNNALSYGSAILNTINAKIQLNVLEGKNMVPYVAQQSISSLSFTERVMYDPQLNYGKYLIYGIIAILIQQAYLAVITPVLITEKFNMVKMKLRSKEGLKKIAIFSLRIFACILCAYLGAIVSFYCAGKYFNIPLRGTLSNYFKLISVFILDLTAAAVMFSVIFNKISDFNRLSMCLSVPTFLTAGYSWPEYMMPGGFSHVVKAIWPLIYVADPLRLISLKGSDINIILPYINGGIYYALFWLPIGIILYGIKIIVFKYIDRKLLT